MAEFNKLGTSLLQFTSLIPLTAAVLIWFTLKEYKNKFTFQSLNFPPSFSFLYFILKLHRRMNFPPSDVSRVCTSGYEIIMRC